MSQWFEMSTGSLVVGEAAYAERLEQSPPGDLVPLADALLGYVSLESATRAPEGTYKKCPSDSDLEHYGMWLLKIIRTQDPEAVVTSSVLSRAHTLGLGIGPEPIGRHFDDLHEFRARLDVPHFSRDGAFKNWSTEDFVANASRLVSSLGGRKPNEGDYREWARVGNGPGPNVIKSAMKGGLRKLNSHLGFPDIRSFEYDDFIDWGVRTMRVNEGQRLSTTSIAILSKRSCGPSDITIYKNFGNLPAFFDKVEDAYLDSEQRRQEHAAELAATFDTLGVAQENAWTDAYKQQFTARYIVAQRCLPNAPKEQLATLATNGPGTFTKSILHTNPELTAGHIELLAVRLEVFDDIWPPYPNDKRILKIDARATNQERRRQSTRRMARRSRPVATSRNTTRTMEEPEKTVA